MTVKQWWSEWWSEWWGFVVFGAAISALLGLAIWVDVSSARAPLRVYRDRSGAECVIIGSRMYTLERSQE